MGDSKIREEELLKEPFFRYFREISNIPRGSGNMKAIGEYLMDFAEARGLDHYMDKAGNVVIESHGSEGMEKMPGVILQCHVDMVAVARPGSGIDMKKEPLKLMVEGDLLFAKDTSLGADNGIGAAYILAILDDKNIKHPPLEAVFTTDEEVGMLGAKELDVKRLRGTRVINIDIETEGIFVSGCTGASRIESLVEVKREEIKGERIRLKITGLLGGHAGVIINKGRGNALQLMGRVLKKIIEKSDARIYSLFGGDADNAVPRECTAEMIIPEKGEEAADIVKSLADDIAEALKKELSGRDDGIIIETEDLGFGTEKCIDKSSAEKVTDLLRLIPHGVQSMSGEIEGLPQLSLNMGIARLSEESFSLIVSIRGSYETEWEDLTDRVARMAQLCGAVPNIYGKHPGWEYRKDSPLRELFLRVYREMFRKEPLVTAVHGGLECGMFISKRPELDCISIGPDIDDVHTTEEKLHISSAVRMWELLLRVLEEGE